VTWEEYTNTSPVCKGEVRNTKALEFNVVRDTKGNKNGFYRYVSSKSKVMKNVGLLLKGQGTKSKDPHWKRMTSENI